MSLEQPYPFEFRCQRAGNCCSIPGGVVRISAEDIEAIADHLGMTVAAARSRYLAVGGDRLAEGPSSRCVFLEGSRETSCGIYPVRPEKCRTWPYWPELLDNPEGLQRAAALCPGIVPHQHDSRPPA